MKRFLLAAWLAMATCAAAQPATFEGEPPEAAAKTLVAAAGDARLILLGEMHGTREIPRLVAHLVTIYAAEGPVLLGLEIPGSGQADLRRYLDSPGADADRAALLATPYWNVQGDQHDGRRSHDVLDLVEHVRLLRAQGRDVSLLAYDAEPGPRIDANARDRIMAARVRASFDALPRGRLLVLTGNVHAQRERPVYAPPQMQVPMGHWLRDKQPWSVDIYAFSGAFWACFDRYCRAAPVNPGQQRTGVLQDEVYDYRLLLDRFTVARLVGAAG
ncbi:MAG TPA: calcium-binding protein [Arenimonas sp.]|uniref:calcium-binding protein n=1 Tax=Arenimonas sp. TaxID=1872635 RepID=UPI002D803022|nr:calcium-binding protein [Arenimonas sp.]HEU0152702.1 calcium-binding protein [Arenimonas sp.]